MKSEKRTRIVFLVGLLLALAFVDGRLEAGPDGSLLKINFDEAVVPFEAWEADCAVEVHHLGLVSVEPDQNKVFEIDVTLTPKTEHTSRFAYWRIPLNQPVQPGMKFTGRLIVDRLPKNAMLTVGVNFVLPEGGSVEATRDCTPVVRSVVDHWVYFGMDVNESLEALVSTHSGRAGAAYIESLFVRFEGLFDDPSGSRVTVRLDDFSITSAFEKRRYELSAAFNETGSTEIVLVDEIGGHPLQLSVKPGNGEFKLQERLERVCVIPKGDSVYFLMDSLALKNTELSVVLEIDYLDEAESQFAIEYPIKADPISGTGGITLSRQIETGTASGLFRTVQFKLDNALFNESIDGVYDFAIRFRGAAMPIARVVLEIPGLSKDQTATAFRRTTLIDTPLEAVEKKVIRLDRATADLPKDDPIYQMMSASRARVRDAIEQTVGAARKMTESSLETFGAAESAARQLLLATQQRVTEYAALADAWALRKKNSDGVLYPLVPFEMIMPNVGLPAKLPAETIELAWRACPGEYEPASFAFFAARQMDVELHTGDLQGQDGAIVSADNIQIHIVKVWSQSGAPYSEWVGESRSVPELLLIDDRIPLDRADTVSLLKRSGPTQTTLIPGATKQFWVTVSVPQDAAAGRYNGSLVVSEGKRQVALVNLSLTVRPFVLRDHGRSIGLDLDAVLGEAPDARRYTVSESLLEKQLADLTAHGVNALSLHAAPNSSLDKTLAYLRKAGLHGALAYLTPTESTEQLQILKEKAEAEGFSPFIVPLVAASSGTMENDTIEATAKTVRSIDALTLARVTDPQLLASIGSLIDVCIVPISPVRLHPGQVRDWRNTLSSQLPPESPSHYWYRWPAFTETPLTNRLYAGYYLWLSGLDGVLAHGYAPDPAGLYQSHDIWKEGAGNKRVPAVTYPSTSGPIPTIQWESFREGVDDLRYLATLESTVAQVAAGSTTPQQKEALDHARTALTEYRKLRGSQLTPRGMQQLRETIAEHIVALTKKP